MKPNIFKLLGIQTKENFHSSFIKSIINSSEYAKEEFINKLNEVSGKDFYYKNLKAQTEKSLSTKGAGRVDIYLTDFKDNDNEGNTRIIIENKIYTGDQNKQLKKYHEHLTKYEKTALFYLTIEGKDASSNSRMELNRNKDYYLLDYAIHIKGWLDSVLKNLNSVLENLKNNNSNTDTIILEISEKSNLKTYIQDYLEVIEELTKYNSLLVSGFKLKKGLEEYEFNALLELRFWQVLEDKIYTEFDKKYLTDNQHRYYTYSKILKANKPKIRGEMPRDYGIVLKTSDSTKNIRISVAAKNPKKFISLRIGQFVNNKWENEEDIIVNDKEISTLNLTKIKYMQENHIKRIIDAIEKIKDI